VPFDAEADETVICWHTNVLSALLRGTDGQSSDQSI